MVRAHYAVVPWERGREHLVRLAFARSKRLVTKWLRNNKDCVHHAHLLFLLDISPDDSGLLS